MAHEGSKTVILAALAGNAAIAVTKLAAGLYTRSSAMLSEAIHSAVDTGNQLVLLYGMRRASRPPDETHPFGHGLELYFWAFVVAILIFGVGAGVSIYEGVEKVRHPHPMESAYINYIVLGLSIAFESGSWWVAMREFRRSKGEQGWLDAVRRSKDPALFTVLFEDTAALLGLVVAFAGVALAETLDAPALDGAASIVIGLILAAAAGFLAYECRSLLTGGCAGRRVTERIRAIAASEPGVVRPNEVLTMHFGPRDILVTLSLDFEDGLSAGEVERAVSNIERRIKREISGACRVFVEAQSFEAHRRSEPGAACTVEAG